MPVVTPPSTRRETAALRRRARRTKIIASAVSLASAGTLLLGGALTVQAGADRTQRVNATREISESTGLEREHLGVYASIAKVRTEQRAKEVIDEATQLLSAAAGKVDATPLATSVASLSNYRNLDQDTVLSLVKETETATATVQAAASQADQAAADQAAAAAAAIAAANTPEGAKATAASLASDNYGWGADQFSCLVSLWQKESGWNYQASNASSGAAGIPQALPGSKMASMGDDWQTNATTQVSWGLDYIHRAYGAPCAAWSHSQSVNWY